MKTKRKAIYHFENNSTKVGRSITALLALLTQKRLSVIFHLRITIVRREYQPEALKRRAMENLFIFVVLFPLVMAVTIGMKKCQNPQPTHIEQNDSIPEGRSLRSLPNVCP